MLKFKRLTVKNLSLIKRYTQKSPLKVCDFSIGVFIMWDGSFSYEYAEYNDTLIVKMYYGKEEWFLPPIGLNIADAVTEIEKYCVEKNERLRFTCVDEGVLDFYKQRYENNSKCNYDRRWSDYIYNYDDIKTFTGKKYSGQRNHINKFKKLYPNYKYHKITKNAIPKLKEFMAQYKTHHKDMGSIEKKEYFNTLTLLDEYSDKYFVGGYITVNGKIVSFSIGEYVGDTLVIHIEKALPEYQGVYPTTFNEFVCHNEKDGIVYINREDDSGDEGLRTSKTQYHPVMLANKNYVVVNNPMTIKRVPVLKKYGLYLDKITEADKEEYYKLYTNKTINKYWGYDYSKDISIPTPDAFFEMVQTDFKNKENVCFAVRSGKGEKLLGEVILYNFGYDGSVEIGVRLFKHSQGKGYGVKLFKIAAEYIKTVLYKTPVAKAYKQNLPSINAILNAGFEKIGENKKYVYFINK